MASRLASATRHRLFIISARANGCTFRERTSAFALDLFAMQRSSGRQRVDTEDLLLGILREEDSFAARLPSKYRFICRQQAEQKLFALNPRSAELARLLPGVKDRHASFFRVLFEHRASCYVAREELFSTFFRYTDKRRDGQKVGFPWLAEPRFQSSASPFSELSAMSGLR